MQRSTSLSPIVLFFALAASACGPPPQPVEEYAPSTGQESQQAGPLLQGDSTEMPPGHPTTGEGHPTGAGSASASTPHHWDGTVRLRGGLAQEEDAFLFVNVKPAGVAMPSYSVKVAVNTGQADGDDFVVPFEITEADAMGGLVPGMDEIVIEACFDHDGYVESKEGQVRNTVAVQVDQSGVEVVLEN